MSHETSNSSAVRPTETGASGGRFPVSVIVLTFNEAENVAPCLDLLNWVDDLIIVDSFSTDGTTEAAVAVRPDVRVFKQPFQDFGAQRNWALDNTVPRHP